MEVRARDGATLHVEARPGRGTPVLLLHGILASSGTWGALADRLEAAGRPVLAMDARGHGRSTPWTEGMDWSPVADARDAVDVLRHAAPEGAHIVGHSRGGTTACWLAVEAPSLVRSLAVVASPPQPTEAFRAAFARRLARADDAREASALRYLAALPDDDFPQHALRRLACPALVVEAAEDPLYAPTHTLFWRAFLPYAAFARVPGDHRFHETREGAAWLAEQLHACWGDG